MKVVIFCEDFSFAGRVRSALLRVGRRSDVGVRWKSKAWPLSALNHTAMAEKLLDDAVDAHLVVISNEQAHSFPDGLRSWLEKWANLPRTAPRALGIFQAQSEGSSIEPSADLTSLLERLDLDIITDARRIERPAIDLVANFSEEPKQRAFIETPQFAEMAT